MRSLQSAVRLAHVGIGSHGDAFGRPVGISQCLAFPMVEQPGLAAALGLADARPELPGPVLGLPDGEVHGLLLLTRQFPEVGIASDLPPVAIDLGNQFAGGGAVVLPLLEMLVEPVGELDQVFVQTRASHALRLS